MGGADINVLKDLVDKKHVGRKSGKGVYVYEKSGSKGRQVNSEASDILQKYRLPTKGW